MSSEVKEAALSAVRPKSTHRKQRSAELSRTRLAPAQERSRRRNDLILEAAADLLETVNIEDLSHSDIASAAGISKASVHYHFPTIAAVQLALGRRFDAELSDHVATIGLQREAQTWADLLRASATEAHAWFNAHRAACEALLGPLMTRENRLAGVNYNMQTGSANLRYIRKYFEVPPQAHLDEVFSYNGEIIDLFWSRSYLQRGFIDEAALEESHRASLGYLRNFLPEFLPRKSPTQSGAKSTS